MYVYLYIHMYVCIDTDIVWYRHTHVSESCSRPSAILISRIGACVPKCGILPQFWSESLLEFTVQTTPSSDLLTFFRCLHHTSGPWNSVGIKDKSLHIASAKLYDVWAALVDLHLAVSRKKTRIAGSGRTLFASIKFLVRSFWYFIRAA